MIEYVKPGQMLRELRGMGYAPRDVASITGINEWNIYRYIRDDADMCGELYVKLYNVWFMAKQRSELRALCESSKREVLRRARQLKRIGKQETTEV